LSLTFTLVVQQKADDKQSHARTCQCQCDGAISGQSRDAAEHEEPEGTAKRKSPFAAGLTVLRGRRSCSRYHYWSCVVAPAHAIRERLGYTPYISSCKGFVWFHRDADSGRILAPAEST
jgi:hypothetical protein